MDDDSLIQNVGGSILPSEDDLEDTNPVDEIIPNNIKNTPLE